MSYCTQLADLDDALLVGLTGSEKASRLMLSREYPLRLVVPRWFRKPGSRNETMFVTRP